MIFQRGNPLDYERWAADPGMDTWSYAHCLPYFKNMEDCRAGADEWRGKMTFTVFPLPACGWILRAKTG